MRLITLILLLAATLLGLCYAAQELSLLRQLRLMRGQPLSLARCVCGPLYMPVCGSDEKTYPNICSAMCQVSVSSSQFQSHIIHDSCVFAKESTHAIFSSLLNATCSALVNRSRKTWPLHVTRKMTFFNNV